MPSSPPPDDHNNGNAPDPHHPKKMDKMDDPTHLSSLPTAVLQTRLSQLRSQSNTLSQTLTAKLATSQSGQNLLHIGPSLSTLPPDLTSLMEALDPLWNDVSEYEKANLVELNRVVREGKEILGLKRRGERGLECGDMVEDLEVAEGDVKRDGIWRVEGRRSGWSGGGGDGGRVDQDEEEGIEGEETGDGIGEGGGVFLDELDHIASLERAAHTTLHLVQELKSSTAEIQSMTGLSPAKQPSTANDASVAAESAGSTTSPAALPSMRTPLPDDTEKAQFLMKLAPRIRRLEGDTIKCLTAQLELVLGEMKKRKTEGGGGGGNVEDESGVGGLIGEDSEGMNVGTREERELLIIGHCLRGLALLGRGKEAESAFARVAIMPLIRSKVSMGRLDEGGSRGECTGLFSLLDDIAYSIASTFGSVLRLSEGIFDMLPPRELKSDGSDEAFPPQGRSMEVDLVTAGVWIPIATALMADPAIKMAIFSPGIASILQANYTALDTFLSELAVSLLKTSSDDGSTSNTSKTVDGGASALESLYFKPVITSKTIELAQDRIYRHPMTSEFSKKWNLPIYYQLRFGECCTRLNKAIALVQREGWEVDVFTGSASVAEDLRNNQGFEVPFFLELYDILLGLWRPDVILRPLTHRFLRGAVQLLSRTIAFVRDGLEGKIKFKDTNAFAPVENGSASTVNGDSFSSGTTVDLPGGKGGSAYCWGERLEEVAAVAWELTVLETSLTHDYVDTIGAAVAPQNSEDRPNFHNTKSELEELRDVASDVLVESSQDIAPIIRQSWDDIIVSILTTRCCAPLSAVKGVAATYRMTNRPPPTQASPFVSTILRPLKEFDDAFANRTPPQVGLGWKESVVGTVSERYSVAVEELIATVQRTEVALKSRKARRAATGGMSDGEKVKLQLYLDYKAFAGSVEDVGVSIQSVEGVVRLGSLTNEAESLYHQSQNGKPSVRSN